MHQTRLQMGSPIAPWLTISIASLLLLTTLFQAAPSLAQGSSSAGGSSFGLNRIELSLYGGWFGGATFLDLPVIAEAANDLGATDILDFSGNPLGRPHYPGQIDAAKKEIEDGWMAGFGAAFFLSPSFAIELVGSYGSSEASVTGQYVDQENLPEEDPTPGRFEWDRSSMDWIMGGANMLYVFSPDRKVKPFVQLGLGGILNRFPKTDDTGALYFSFAAGARYQLSERLDVEAQYQSVLFTWDQDEVALNETVQYPMVTLGLVWKYEVPEETPAQPLEDGSSSESGQPADGEPGGS